MSFHTSELSGALAHAPAPTTLAPATLAPATLAPDTPASETLALTVVQTLVPAKPVPASPVLVGPALRLPVRRALVCVPAKNEAKRLPGFLEALSRAVTRAQAGGIACELVVALDGCTDASKAIVDVAARSFACSVHVATLPPVEAPDAGRVRRAAMEAALARVEPGARAGCALLTTDADTHVAPDWIVASAHALADADLVAGWVDWDDEEPIAALVRQEHYFSELHRLRRRVDPVAWDARDPHHKQYGASLGIRAAAYAAVGGLPPLASSEDVALTRAVRLAGLRVRQDRAVRVLTSTRRAGRASGGFSDAIMSVVGHELEDGALMQVVDPRYHHALFRQSARLRRAFGATGQATGQAKTGALDMMGAGGTSIPDFELQQAWAASPTADAFATRLLDPLPGERTAPRVPLHEAEAWVAAELGAARNMHDIADTPMTARRAGTHTTSRHPINAHTIKAHTATTRTTPEKTIKEETA